MKLADDVWDVICDYLLKYRKVKATPKLKRAIEQATKITPFEGGVFMAIGNEFDLFVVPAKRGKWNIRGEVGKYLAGMLEKYDTVIVKIYAHNQASLRLAKHFGFVETDRTGDTIKLELKNG